MKNIIQKWYKTLCFPSKYDDEFQSLLENIECSPFSISSYTPSINDCQKNFLDFLYMCEELSLQYKERGIDHNIFMDTIQDMVLWTNVYYDIYGKLGLEEVYWLYMHFSFKVFKLGRLQFFMTDNEMEIHIPAGGNLSPEECDKSIAFSKTFFAKYFPDYSYDVYFCHSWLLDDTLSKFLKKDSNILAFASRFEIVEKEESFACLKYIFRWDIRPHNLSEYPANNAFQQRIKDYVLSGGKFYNVKGYIKVR